MLKLTLTLNTDRLDQALLELGEPVLCVIYNSQYYWTWINDGRGEVRPIHAKVLHWKGPNGEDIFAMHAGPVAPRHMREDSYPEIMLKASELRGNFPVGRAGVVAFVNEMGKLAIEAMKVRTPVITGALQRGYSLEEAK